MAFLDPTFIAAAQRDSVTLEHDGAEYTFRATNAVGFLSGRFRLRAELEVVDGSGEVRGYVIEDSPTEHGAASVDRFEQAAPVLVRTTEAALREILR